jgi:hypothetical protein
MEKTSESHGPSPWKVLRAEYVFKQSWLTFLVADSMARPPALALVVDTRTIRHVTNLEHKEMVG